MLILCPSCATSYDVDVASLRPNGRQVRCVRCRTVWHADLSQADKLIAAAEALAQVRRTVEAMAEVGAESADPFPPEEEEAAAAESAWADPPADEAAADAPPEATETQAAVADRAEPANEASDSAEMESPPIVPVDLDEGRTPVAVEVDHEPSEAEEPLEDIESVAARRSRRNSKREPWSWPLSRLQSAILALLLIDAILIGWRIDLVRVLPQTASFYARLGLPVNLRGLDFIDVTTSTEEHENVPILVVTGNIVNDTNKIVDVPHLKFVVRNAARQEIYSWTAVPPRGLLPPGETVVFHTRLASPPPDVEDVLVRFVNRYDFIAGGR